MFFFFGSVGVCSKIVGFVSFRKFCSVVFYLNLDLLATSLFFLVLQVIFIVVASASAVHSSFKGGLKDFFEKSFLVQVVSAQDCWLSCHITDFSCAVHNVYCNCKCNCCPLLFKVGLKTFFYKIIFFRLNWCLLKDSLFL